MRLRDKGRDMAGVFIVEDDTSVQMLLRIALRTRNHEVVGVAANAEEAKDAILSLNPDLCLIDICLKSYTSGIDMAEYVIEKLGIPVVVMSSDDHPTLPVPFVLKPICLPHLFAMIDRALETPRLWDQPLRS
jgi:DNA-binding NtrC family response regulator